MEMIGWIGSMLLALCGLPQTIMSLRQGHSNGISAMMLLMWLVGEVLTLMYVWPKQDIPLLVNYSINLICISIILWYKAFPRVVA